MSAAAPAMTSLTSSRLVAPGLALAVLLIVAVPLFLRLPLTNDAEVYDLQAEIVRQGGTLYREVLEPNLPGVVALHLAVRSLLGSSAEALRLFDLLLMGITVLAAARIVRLSTGNPAAALWTVFGLLACYLSSSEWCHCQRDVWMLAPALSALALRLDGVLSPVSWRKAFLEGVLWGLAVWLKPYVVVPAGLVWLVSGRLQTGAGTWWRNAVACFGGGLMVGATGIVIMLITGCWFDFLDTLRHWNPDYFAAGRAHWSWNRGLGVMWRMSPWTLLQLPAVLVTFVAVWQQFRRQRQGLPGTPQQAGTCLLAALYVGWTVQAWLFQHQFDYVFLPSVLLALLLVAQVAAGQRQGDRRVLYGWCGLALLVLVSSPLTESRRLQHWAECVAGKASVATQAELMHFQNPSPGDLQKVAEFLREQKVRDRDVCFYNSDFISLYRRLNLQPPVRYAYLFETLQFFPQRREAILAEVAAAPQRFVVTDLVSCGMSRRLAEEVGPGGPQTPPPSYAASPQDKFPWSLPVVFRAGTYLVHRVEPVAAAVSELTDSESLQTRASHP